MKAIDWRGDSLQILQGFSEEVRKTIGSDLWLLQSGERPLHARPLSTVGRGVWELKASDADGQFRLVYIVRRGDRIYALHAFQKKTQSTRKSDIDLAKARLKEI
jgi:phage-related protein